MLLAACGGDDDDDGGAQPTATGAAAKSGPGTVSITSSAIAGRTNAVLLISVAPQAGGPLLAQACVPITSDRFSAPSTIMTEAVQGQAPCSGPARKTTFPDGTYTLTAGIYGPPSQTPEAETRLEVRVAGDVTVQINGTALSR